MSDATVPVHIEKVVYGGSGLGRLPDGRAVFVPFTAAGDDADILIVAEHPRHAEGRLCGLRTASAARTQPRCRHFMRCGGCQYQHLDYQAQVCTKRDQLVETLRRLGGMDPVPAVSDTVASAHPERYRNRVTLRRFTGAEGSVQFGFSESSSSVLFTPEECILPEQRLWSFLTDSLRSFARDPHLVPDSAERLTARLPSAGAPLLYFDRGPSEPCWMEETVAGRQFRVPAHAFWQVNPDVLPALVSTVRNWTATGGELFVDAYAGVGLFSATAGAAFSRRIVVETNRQALRAAKENHRCHGVEDATFLSMPAEVALPRQLDQHAAALDQTTVLLDPPRAGCARGAIRALTKHRPSRIVYVSCDPATLARDVRALCGTGDYALRRLALLDMFPQTAHFETVALLEQ